MHSYELLLHNLSYIRRKLVIRTLKFWTILNRAIWNAEKNLLNGILLSSSFSHSPTLYPLQICCQVGNDTDTWQSHILLWKSITFPMSDMDRNLWGLLWIDRSNEIYKQSFVHGWVLYKIGRVFSAKYLY